MSSFSKPLQVCGGLMGNNLVAKLWMGYIPHESHHTYMGPRDSPTQVLVRKAFAWAFRIRTSWPHGFEKTIWNKYEIVPMLGTPRPTPQDQVFTIWANRFLTYFHHWPIWMIKFLSVIRHMRFVCTSESGHKKSLGIVDTSLGVFSHQLITFLS
jgi:hypothetical protein